MTGLLTGRNHINRHYVPYLGHSLAEDMPNVCGVKRLGLYLRVRFSARRSLLQRE